MNWLELNSEVRVDELETLSFEHPIAVFKHSTRCPVSVFAKKAFEKEWQAPESECPVYLLDLLAFRPVSNAVAEKFNVVHQSPQLIVLHKGKVVYTASHENISASDACNAILVAAS